MLEKGYDIDDDFLLSSECRCLGEVERRHMLSAETVAEAIGKTTKCRSMFDRIPPTGLSAAEASKMLPPSAKKDAAHENHWCPRRKVWGLSEPKPMVRSWYVMIGRP
eukprot:2198760-Amphidinium_carterae.1